MTETLANRELILPALYSWHDDDFVKADLEEHCRFVRRAAETEPVLTEMIFTSPAPLLIRGSTAVMKPTSVSFFAG